MTSIARAENVIGAKPAAEPNTFCDPLKHISIFNSSTFKSAAPSEDTASTMNNALFLQFKLLLEFSLIFFSIFFRNRLPVAEIAQFIKILNNTR